MKTVILCGGKGTRMGKIDVPKPLVEVGEKPVLWHIMKIYSFYGFNDFILCLGYQGDKIVKYFAGKPLGNRREVTKEYPDEGWSITFVDTGVDTNTGGRIKRVEDHLDDTFFATYGDGLSDINIKGLLEFHKVHGKLATLTAVQSTTTFGILKLDADRVVDFTEKPPLKEWINGGFFVFEPRALDLVGENDVLEREAFHRLIERGELAAYRHSGFWRCMDTYKENIELNELWRNGKAAWAVWR